MTAENQQTGVLAQHQAALAEGRFLIQQCTGCGQHIYFPREVCPHCGSDDLALVAPTGLGTVYSVTTVRRKPDAGGDDNVCLIDLDEGVRQLRGEGGERQVQGVQTALAHGNGGTLSSQSTAILGTFETL